MTYGAAAHHFVWHGSKGKGSGDLWGARGELLTAKFLQASEICIGTVLIGISKNVAICFEYRWYLRPLRFSIPGIISQVQPTPAVVWKCAHFPEWWCTGGRSDPSCLPTGFPVPFEGVWPWLQWSCSPKQVKKKLTLVQQTCINMSRVTRQKTGSDSQCHVIDFSLFIKVASDIPKVPKESIFYGPVWNLSRESRIHTQRWNHMKNNHTGRVDTIR